MPSFRRLEDIPSTFSTASIPSLVRLHEGPTTSACPIGKRILLAASGGKLVLVDRRGTELASAVHPSLRGSKEEAVVTDIVASGHRFAASMGRCIAFGEIVDDEIRFTAQTKMFAESFDELYVDGDAVIAYGNFDFHHFSWDGTALTRTASNLLEVKILQAFAVLHNVQELHSQLGAAGPVVTKEIREILESAVASADETFEPAKYSLSAGKGGKKATAAINAAVKELVTLLGIAAKEAPAVAKSIFEFAAARKGISIGVADSTRDRSAHTRRTEDGKVVVERTWRTGMPYLVDAGDFDGEALEVGKGLFADESAKSLYVLYEDRLERIDTSSGSRETLYRGRIDACFFNERKQLVISTHESLEFFNCSPKVVLFDPVSRTSEVIERAAANDAGIIQGETPATIRDLEGREILQTEYLVEILSINREMRTVAFIDRMERLELGDGKTRIARADAPKPIAALGKLGHVRLGREVAFAAPLTYSSGEAEISMFDFESAKPRAFEGFVMAGPYACVDDVLYAQEESRDGARLSELSKDGVKSGPDLPARPGREHAGSRIGRLVVQHVSDDYVVVSNDGGASAVWILDRRTLAPIGEPLFHPTLDYVAVAVDGDVVSMLCSDNSIQRYRLKM